MVTKQLTKEQALSILFEATASVPMNREQHALVGQAFQTLKAAITPAKEEKEPNERKQSKGQKSKPQLV